MKDNMEDNIKDNMVNHPPHYTQGRIECIEAIEAAYGTLSTIDFCIGNAFKYIFRCKKKWDTDEDIKKAIWYCNKALELREKYREGAKNNYK